MSDGVNSQDYEIGALGRTWSHDDGAPHPANRPKAHVGFCADTAASRQEAAA